MGTPSEATHGPARTKPRIDALSVALDETAAHEDALAATVAVFRALANPNRLVVLQVLSEPKTVAQLRVELQIADPGSKLQDLEVVGLVERVDDSYPVQWQRIPGVAGSLVELIERFSSSC